MKKLIICFGLFVGASSCTSNNDFNKAKKILESQGLTNIESTGYKPFCCDEKDGWSTGFKATDKQGNPVKGCICSGLLKGVTIRYQ